MIKKTLQVVFLLFFCYSSAQDFSSEWEGHFSYLNIKDVVEGNGKVYAASENALFVYDPQTFNIETLNTVNGLSGEFISAIHYSEVWGVLVIGYENGLMEIYIESSQEILSVVDILEKPTIPPDKKKINHFNEFNNYIYIATDYGISVYDLERLEFGDTYFIGDGGSQIIVSATAVFEGYLYAACQSGAGIRRALVDSSNLIDYQVWSQVISGNFVEIVSEGTKLFTARLNNSFYETNGTIFNQLFTFPERILEVNYLEGYLLITLPSTVFVYDSNFGLLATISNTGIDKNFTSATYLDNDVYIGTEGKGVLIADLDNLNNLTPIYPDGPLQNSSFSVQAGYGHLWVTYGDYTLSYNPAPLRTYGVSHLYDEEWFNIPYDSLQFTARDLNAISINPFKPENVFISSFHDGILEIDNNNPTRLFNHTNSGLESLFLPSAPNFISIRVSGTVFDNQGKLWSMTARVDRPLKSYDPNSGQWNGYDFTAIIPEGITDEFGFSDIVIGPDNTKWIGGFISGLIGFNNETGAIKNINDEHSNLPSEKVRALALDRRNQLWIGTEKGLRVLFNTSNFFANHDVTTFPIIILEDGIPKELLEQQYITDIKVDGSNNKWVGTIGSGVFYFSADGQETIHHFTKNNSPLPSNNVIDMALDENNGIVYFGTDRGLVAFRSGGSSPQESLSDAFIYPNPVRPTFNIAEEKVKIRDISENCNIKITDIEGNLVAEAQSNRNLRFNGYNLEIDGGTAFWNGRNLSNNVVASGVYIVMLSDLDTLETKVLKLMVIR